MFAFVSLKYLLCVGVIKWKGYVWVWFSLQSSVFIKAACVRPDIATEEGNAELS